jgi:hypothetical protein
MVHKQSKPVVEQGSPNNLNLNNFIIIEAMGLKVIARYLEWHHVPSKCHDNLHSCSKVISGGQTDW